jgi:hypothetical protein
LPLADDLLLLRLSFRYDFPALDVVYFWPLALGRRAPLSKYPQLLSPVLTLAQGVDGENL